MMTSNLQQISGGIIYELAKRRHDAVAVQGVAQQSFFKITRMLLVMSILYALLTMPVVIYDTVWGYTLNDAPKMYMLSHLLHLRNHSVNFYVYLLSSKKFREQVKRM